MTTVQIFYAADETYRQIVYHEASHAAVAEVLCPGNVTLVSIRSNGSDCGGLTDYYNDNSKTYLYQKKTHIIRALSGIAATEQKLGLFGMGGSRDFYIVFNAVHDLVINDCICEFHLHASEYNDSERLPSEQEQIVSSEMEHYYRKAKEILSLNSEFPEKLATALAKKALLSAVDIEKIRSECKIVSISI